MLGERSEQRGLWEADRLYIDHVGRGSFYGLLAAMECRVGLAMAASVEPMPVWSCPRKQVWD